MNCAVYSPTEDERSRVEGCRPEHGPCVPDSEDGACRRCGRPETGLGRFWLFTRATAPVLLWCPVHGLARVFCLRQDLASPEVQPLARKPLLPVPTWALGARARPWGPPQLSRAVLFVHGGWGVSCKVNSQRKK